QDPRVSLHLTDGRAYLERTQQRYDLIIFALPDSLTLVQGQSALRLESYLFTEEAFASARDHLAPGGVFAMYNYYRQPWLVDRLAGTLASVFGRPPCAEQSGRTPAIGSLSVLADGNPPGGMRCNDVWDVPPG